MSAAGLSERIDLRPIPVEDLPERDILDAIWLAGPFLPESVIPVAIELARAAPQPGGWLPFGAHAAPPGHSRTAAQVRQPRCRSRCGPLLEADRATTRASLGEKLRKGLAKTDAGVARAEAVTVTGPAFSASRALGLSSDH